MKIGIISDIHSDFLSLEKALKELKKKGYDTLVCLGDIVGYSYHYHKYFDGRDNNACVALVKESCDLVIAGNHDVYWAQKIPYYFKKLGFPENWCSLSLSERMEISRTKVWLYEDEEEKEIGEESKEFLSGLPETEIVPCEHFSILFTHFLYPDLTGSTRFFPEDEHDFKDHFKFQKKHKCLIGIMGHGHLQGYSITTRKTLNYYYFGKRLLEKVPQIIIGPGITRGESQNGYMLLDTAIPELEVFSL